MPFPLLIPIAFGAVSAITAVVGVKKGYDGCMDISKVREIVGTAHRRGRTAMADVERMRLTVNRQADAYGDLLLTVQRETFGRFVAFVNRIGQKSSMGRCQVLDSVDITAPQFEEFKVAVIRAQNIASGSVSMALGSMGASVGTKTLIGLYGVSSSGTAISTLSGAAATKATLAWLGGGSLAAGGGGTALGAMVLGGITVAPAMLIGGFVLAKRGAQAMEEAKRYESEVLVEIAKIRAVVGFMQGIVTRIGELDGLVRELDKRTNAALNKLDPARFDLNNPGHVRAFQQTGLLLKALAAIMKTPVLDTEGRAGRESKEVYCRYRNLGGQ